LDLCWRNGDEPAFKPRPLDDVVEGRLQRAYDLRQVADDLARFRIGRAAFERPGHQAQRMQRLAQVMRDPGQELGRAGPCVGPRRLLLCCGSGLAGEVAHEPGEDPLSVKPGFTDGDLCGEPGAVLAPGEDPAIGADDAFDPSLAIAPKI